MCIKSPFFALCALLFSVSVPLFGATFHLDPIDGDMSNDGSAGSPWSTLGEVFDGGMIESYKFDSKPAVPGAPMTVKNEGGPVRSGDTLLLKTGFHGRIYAVEYYNTDYITIMAAAGHKPTVSSLEIRSGCKWTISGLTISPQLDSTYEKRTLLQFSSHSWTGPSYDCIVEHCTGYSIEDASGWSADDWNDLACSALSLPGDSMIARHNHFKNVNFGISVSGDFARVQYNTIENFSGDGMRGTGDHGTFEYNIIKNCYDVNANHDDGFQSWSRGEDGKVGTGVVKGIVLRGNTIINHEDPNQPHRGTLQGIGCFDGMFEDWVIENNVIMVDHWHGITLLGATDCRIVNNTVVDLNSERPGPPWIKIGDHKNGTKSSGCVIRNNLATSISRNEDVTIDHNIIVDDYDAFFVDYANGDLRLKAGCIAIDSGSAEYAPLEDFSSAIRRDRIDVGAFEFAGENGIKPIRPRTTTSSHPDRIQVFDLRGRLIRTVHNAGHDVKIFIRQSSGGSTVYIIGRPNTKQGGKQLVVED